MIPKIICSYFRVYTKRLERNWTDSWWFTTLYQWTSNYFDHPSSIIDFISLRLNFLSNDRGGIQSTFPRCGFIYSVIIGIAYIHIYIHYTNPYKLEKIRSVWIIYRSRINCANHTNPTYLIITTVWEQLVNYTTKET